MIDEKYYNQNFYKITLCNLMNNFPLETDTLGLYISPNKIFTDEECNKIIELGYSSNLEYQQSVDAVNKNDFNSKMIYLLPSENTNYIYDRLRKLVCQKNKEIWNYNLYDFGEPLKFTEYNYIEKSSTCIHSDLGKGSITKFRKLTIVVQLSDENTYEGGELMVQFDSKLIPVSKKRGSVIIFPSFLMHRVMPVTKGIRNSLVTFAFGPPFS